MHVLVSAYSCEPSRGSEPGIGWNTVVELSKDYRLTVLTRAINQDAIEAGAALTELRQTRFIYIDLPGPLRLSQRGTRGLYWYYIIWQFLAWRRALVEHRRDPVDIAYHATFCSLHMPVFMHRLPVPFIFGPLAGGEMSSPAFWRGGGARAWIYDAARALRMQTTRVDPLVQLALRHAHRIIVATPETERFLPRFINSAETLHTTAIEPDLTHYAIPLRSGTRIVSAGRLVHWKGFHLGIRAFARISQQYPEVSLTIVGDGPQRARLAALASSLDLDNRVIFAGERTRDETLEIMATSDLLLFPSLHDSGAATILEGMALGLPVVCLDTGGARISVSDDSGVRIPVTTPAQVVNDLADALDSLLGNANRRIEMGASGRQRATTRFTWQKRTQRLKQFINTAVRRPTAHESDQVNDGA